MLVRRSKRTMRMSTGEARVLHALGVVDFIEKVERAPPAPALPPRGAYARRDMVASRPPALATPVPLATKEAPSDGEA